MKRLGVVMSLFLFVTLCYTQQYIADYSVAKEEVLRGIPEDVINQARNEFKILYFHTSHGTHVTFGVNGIQSYKSSDGSLFAAKVVDVRYNDVLSASDSLELYDWFGWDLSEQETTFDDYTRSFLDKDEYDDINVVMWSWCNIAGHDPANNYLPLMQDLIDEYSDGGSKIGTGEGQREKPVKFIFMTGHANENSNIGDGKPKNQAEIINSFCNTNGYLCLDYYSIDSHDMNDGYWEDASDNAVSSLYKDAGGATNNFYMDYQDTHVLGEDYYYNRTFNGDINTGEHLTQHITANRKAYAMWWILARLTGWKGISTIAKSEPKKNINLIFNQRTNQVDLVNFKWGDKPICRVYDLTGSLRIEKKVNSKVILLNSLNKGMYIVSLITSDGIVTKKILVNR